MRGLSKLFVILFGLTLLTACNLGGGAPDAEVVEGETAAEQTMPAPEEVDALDAELEMTVEEETALDEEIDELEAEEF